MCLLKSGSAVSRLEYPEEVGLVAVVGAEIPQPSTTTARHRTTEAATASLVPSTLSVQATSKPDLKMLPLRYGSRCEY